MKRSGPERGAANRGDLRPLDLATFAARLARALSGSPPHPAVVARLHAHHAELVLWSARIDLVGPAAEGDLFERHYAESLAALPLLVESDRRLVDLGSGAGFPGFVLAAARPDLEVLLVEPRQKRRAFLAAATRRASLSCRCLDARVSANAPPELPGGIDIVTLRALRLERQALERLLPLLSRRGRILVWSGREGLELPGGLRAGSVLPLAGAIHRAIRVYERSDDR